MAEISAKALRQFVAASLTAFFFVLFSASFIVPQSSVQATAPTPQPIQLDESGEPAPAQADAAGLEDVAAFGQFVDQFFQQAVANQEIPGGVISVVKDGEVFFKGGYGYADLEQQRPADPDQTLFRVASLSKLLTATAAIQLSEQGLIQLDDDIAPLLDFAIDNPFPTPITWRHLMLHTDGFSKRRIGLAARTAAEQTPLGDYLATHMPPVEWPPGQLYSYSSHSIALLGYLIERVSGQPFNQYIDENILQPLAMQRSTFAQPPAAALRPHLATGYQKRKGQFEPVPYLYLNIYPAASLQATATDMAHFMLAHLQAGGYQGQQILQPETVQQMHTIHFRHHPRLPGTSYGFHQRYANGLNTLGHLGSLRGYSSALMLIPAQNIGIFISANSFSGVHDQFLEAFYERYFPAESPSTESVYKPDDLSRLTGVYRDLEYPRHTPAKLTALAQRIWVDADDQTLTIKAPNLFFAKKVESQQLAPVEPLVFRRLEDDALAAFEVDKTGQIRYLFNPLFGTIGAYQRVPWYEVGWIHGVALLFCAFTFLWATAVGLIGPIFKQDSKTHKPRSHPWVLQLAGLSGLLNLVFLIGLPLGLWLTGAWKLAYGMPGFAIALFCLPILTTALLPLVLLAAFKVSRAQDWPTGARIRYGLFTLGAVGFVPLLLYWNLLGFQF